MYFYDITALNVPVFYSRDFHFENNYHMHNVEFGNQNIRVFCHILINEKKITSKRVYRIYM